MNNHQECECLFLYSDQNIHPEVLSNLAEYSNGPEQLPNYSKRLKNITKLFGVFLINTL